ncbi:MAG: hypothetical protein V7651_00270 [Hyphomonas oceanitis]|uniref:hypothetical protein n=1 Tax=Hyphomonas oceanitis TaxID=81033 RepID=UPI003002ED20
MDLPARAQLYAFVHPVCWPWLWFQLWRLGAWIQSNKRDVLFHVDRYGNLRIDFISDAPRDPSRYTYEAPVVPAWASPGLASDMPETLAATARPARPGTVLPLRELHLISAPDMLDTS